MSGRRSPVAVLLLSRFGDVRVAVHGLLTASASLLGSTGSREHGLSCSAACGIFLEPGMGPAFPALAGEFPTTGPPAKSLSVLL